MKVHSMYAGIMENKVSVVFEDLNKMLNKKKDKGASKFSEKQRLILSLPKALCLVKMYAYGEAETLFLEFIEGYKEFDLEVQLFFKMYLSVAIFLSRSISNRKDKRSQTVLRTLLQKVLE